MQRLPGSNRGDGGKNFYRQFRRMLGNGASPTFRPLAWKPGTRLLILLGLIATLLIPIVLLLRNGRYRDPFIEEKAKLVEVLNVQRENQHFSPLTARDLVVSGSDYVPPCCQGLMGGNCYFGFSGDKSLSTAIKRTARSDGKKLKIGFITYATGKIKMKRIFKVDVHQ
jgi:hypothetical protein